MGLDVFDIVAVILGVIFTIRKLDAQRREPTEFPHVDRARFIAWRGRETTVYTVGMMACFGKVLAKVVIAQVLAQRLPYTTLRWIGATVDLSWLLLTLGTLIAGYRVALLRTKLRIVLGGLVMKDAAAVNSELKSAIAEMKAGQVEGAQEALARLSSQAGEGQRAVALYYLGECFLLQGKREEALDAFQESIETDPSLTEPRQALERLGRGV